LPRIFTGRSNRNCFKFDQKSSGIKIAGRPNFGTRNAGPLGEELAAILLGSASSGTSFRFDPATCSTLYLDALKPAEVFNRYDSEGPGLVARPQRLTPLTPVL